MRTCVHLWLAAASGLYACQPSEAPRVSVPVLVDGSGIVATKSNLGYVVTVESARIALRDILFTVAGEAHTTGELRLARRALDALFPAARAHPGHYQGGEVTGELPGAWIADFLGGNGAALGTAVLFPGNYHGINFTFRSAGEEDGLTAGDPLEGHTAVLQGTASRDGKTFSFTFVMDSPDGRQMVGAELDLVLEEAAAPTLGLRFLLTDPLEGDTLFDGVDFAALDSDGDGKVAIGPDAADPATEDAYYLLRRTLQAHDQYEMKPIAR